jgi:hypothetical protein
MQKIIRIDDLVIVTLDEGQTYQKSDITDEEFNRIINAECEDDIIDIFCPKLAEIKQEVKLIEELEERVRKSNLLEWRDDAVYFPIVSELSVPKELVLSILNAEDTNDTLKIETYKNFWTLMSLNPDEQCRQNLYWFLERNGLVISKHGFFVAYRNVDPTREEGVYTDHRSRTQWRFAYQKFKEGVIDRGMMNMKLIREDDNLCKVQSLITRMGNLHIQ